MIIAYWFDDTEDIISLTDDENTLVLLTKNRYVKKRPATEDEEKIYKAGHSIYSLGTLGRIIASICKKNVKNAKKNENNV